MELQSGNAQFWVKIDEFFSRVTLKFDRWPWKTIGHLFYATSDFVHHFVAIGQFKLDLQSGNAQFGSKSTIYLAVWPWNLTDDLEKQKDTSSKHHQALCIISSSYVNSNRSYSPKTVKLGFDLCDLELWPLTLTFCMDITLVIGNNSRKFHDDTMMGTLSKRCYRQTDRQTDRQTEIAILKPAWSQLKTIFQIEMYCIQCFLAATKQLYKWYFPSVCLSVRLSHFFDYVPIFVSSWNFQELLPMTKVRSMQKVKVRGQRSRSQRSQPNLTVSGLYLQFEFTYDD